MTVPRQVRTVLAYSQRLRRFLGATMTSDEARSTIRDHLARREQAFLLILERAVYGNPVSPYRRLLEWAGIDLARVRELVAECGVEGTLERLYDAGVYVTLDELKGRRPIRRAGLEFKPRATDFDNPLLSSAYEGLSSGSRGPRSRVLVDFDSLAHESAYAYCYLEANGLDGAAIALWRPAPPAADGLKGIFRYVHIDRRPAKWFSPARFLWDAESLRAAVFSYYTLLAARAFGRSLPRPEFVARDNAVRIARWLDEMRRRGRRAVIDTSASAATRIALAATEHGLDISGTNFKAGGEPYTRGKQEVIAAAGATVGSHYGMSEMGTIGLGCANPAVLDDLHLFTDKLAFIRRDKQVDESGDSVPALVYTTLLRSCPKIMLNTESGDYASVAERDCGCLFGELGLTTHLTGLRSYEKLTSDGVKFVMGRNLFELLEEVLPQRFGGHPTDYQLVEEEESGLPRVSVIVAPRVGPVDEDAVVATVIESLRAFRAGGRLMSDQWLQGGTLRVIRREPHASGSRKVLPLYVLGERSPDEAAVR
jgi:hypothetical protein